MPYDMNEPSETPNLDSTPNPSSPWYGRGSSKQPAKVKRSSYAAGKLTLILVGLLMLGTASFNPGSADKIIDNGGVQHAPTLAALSAGCVGIINWKEPPADQIGWIQPNVGAFLWLSIPPVSGNFSPIPWKTSGYMPGNLVNPPRMPATVANLYRGWVVIWYAKTPTAGSLDGLKDWSHFMAPGNPVLIAQWPDGVSKNSWPKGRNILYSAWGISETCTNFDVKAAEEFRTYAAKSKAPGFGVSLEASGPAALVRTADLYSKQTLNELK